MPTPAIAFTVMAVLPTHDVPTDLRLRLDVSPKELGLGDVIFVRAVVTNVSKEVTTAPRAYPFGMGMVLQLRDDNERITYHFPSSGTGIYGHGADTPLEPGEERTLANGLFAVPRLDEIENRFWNPAHWPAGKYRLVASGRGMVAGEDLIIKRRPEAEMKALLEHYGKGPNARVPRGWDLYYPTIDMFGYLSFPLDSNHPEKLAALEKTLGPGSLRDIVHVVRLLHAVYGAEDLEQKRQATVELLTWLDSRPEVERDYLVQRLYSWAANTNKGLGLYAFELADKIIPRLPVHRRKECRQTIDRRRSAYMKYLEKQKAEAAGKGEVKEADDEKTPEPVRLE